VNIVGGLYWLPLQLTVFLFGRRDCKWCGHCQCHWCWFVVWVSCMCQHV